ncbi:hypothetical protein quinque_006954 [Culex quinquefasciatus]
MTTEVPLGCVGIRNRFIDKFLVSSPNYHDADRRHVAYHTRSQQWVISKDGANFRIKHAAFQEDLYESEQSWNGNYVFTWVPKTIITDGGASWNIYESEPGFYYIKNVKFGHCLHATVASAWIYALAECNGGHKDQWKLHPLRCNTHNG